MDPIAIKITFQDFPESLTNYTLCLFYLFSILLCIIIVTLFVNLFDLLYYQINKRNYLYIPDAN
jgi:hypothetical protein